MNQYVFAIFLLGIAVLSEYVYFFGNVEKRKI